jgi:hypothetical protein
MFSRIDLMASLAFDAMAVKADPIEAIEVLTSSTAPLKSLTLATFQRLAPERSDMRHLLL